MLAVKNVVDNEYCYNQIRTVCEETTKEVPRELCTFNYVRKAETLSATTTQVLGTLGGVHGVDEWPFISS